MKTRLLILVAFSFLVSCHEQTPLEKGTALATDYVKKHLYYPDSYEMVECVVDTAYAPMETPETLEALLSFSDKYKELKDLEFDLKSKERSYELYKSSYNDLRKYGLSDSFSEYQYKEAKEEFEKVQQKYDKIVEQLQEMALSFQNLQEQEPIPNGWKIVHSYKAKTNGGMVRTSGTYLLANQEMSDVIYAVDEEQLNAIMSISEELKSDF